jgi:hypothetical protein
LIPFIDLSYDLSPIVGIEESFGSRPPSERTLFRSEEMTCIGIANSLGVCRLSFRQPVGSKGKRRKARPAAASGLASADVDRGPRGGVGVGGVGGDAGTQVAKGS